MRGALPPAQAGRDRDRLLGGVLDVDLEVVLEVLADAGQVVDHVDPERRQVLLVADTGELEQLRGVDRAAAEDHLAGVDGASPSGAEVVDADRPLAVEPHLRGQRQRLHVQVAAVSDGVQVGARGREPAAAVQVAVEPREPLLAVAVDVVGEVVAGLLRRLEERAEQRVVGRALLEHEGPVATAPLVGADGAVDQHPGLHALEVRQAVGVAPLLHAGLRGPPLVVHRVAALEDHPVDAGGAAEHLAACVRHPASVEVRLGVGLVAPVVEPVADRERQRRGHVDERVDPPVGPAGLQDQHAGAAVGGDAGWPGRTRPSRRPRSPRRSGRSSGLPVDVPVDVPAVDPSNQRCTAGRMLCQTCLVSRYSASPCSPSSRPTPDCL